MSDDKSRSDLVEFADKHLDETLARFEEGYRPIWETQAELGRTLISLASGALVLSISVAQFFAEKIKDPQWVWLLPAAWILFAITVLLGASRQGWMGTARSLRALLEPLRGEIRKQIHALEPTEDRSAKFDAVLGSAIDKASAVPDRAATVFNRLTVAMHWSFAFGLVAILLFAIKNLPF